MILVGTKEAKPEGDGVFVGGKEFLKGTAPGPGYYAHSIYPFTIAGFEQANVKGEELGGTYYDGKFVWQYLVNVFGFTDGSTHYVLILGLE